MKTAAFLLFLLDLLLVVGCHEMSYVPILMEGADVAFYNNGFSAQMKGRELDFKVHPKGLQHLYDGVKDVDNQVHSLVVSVRSFINNEQL